MALSPLVPEIARARREQASPREIAQLIRGAEITRDPVEFKVLTGALIPDRRAAADGEEDGEAQPTVLGTTSSTDIDLYGTRMKPAALESMRRSAQDNLTLFLNHDYTIPESIFGSVLDATKRRRKGEDGQSFTDLDILAGVATANPRAMDCYEHIKRKVKLGFSIGALILDWQWETPEGEKIDVDPDDWWAMFFGPTDDAVMAILDVLLVEASLVGVPANRRSWVQNAARAIRAAGRSLAAHRTAGGIIVPTTSTRAKDDKDEQDEAREAQRKREETCGIAPKEGGNVTCPSEYESFADKESWWGDWTNYKFPLDTKAHADNAASRIEDEDVRSEYTAKEQDIIKEHIEKRQAEFGEDDDQETAEDGVRADDLATSAVSDAGAGRSVAALEARLGYDAPRAEPATAPVPAAGVTPPAATSDPVPTGAVRAAGAATTEPTAAIAVADVLRRALDLALATRAGGEYSAENAGMLCAAHDAIAHALNMRCCGMDGCDGHAGERDYSDRAGDDADGDGIPDDEDPADAARMLDLRAEIAAARHLRDEARAEYQTLCVARDAATLELAQAQVALRTAEATPLGRPTQRARPIDPRNVKTLSADELAALPYEDALARIAELRAADQA